MVTVLDVVGRSVANGSSGAGIEFDPERARFWVAMERIAVSGVCDRFKERKIGKEVKERTFKQDYSGFGRICVDY